MSLIPKLMTSFYLLRLELKKKALNNLKIYVTASGPYRGAAFSTRIKIKGRKKEESG